MYIYIYSIYVYYIFTITQNLLLAVDAMDVAKEDIDRLPFPATMEKISGL